jgi:hypothetical protein
VEGVSVLRCLRKLGCARRVLGEATDLRKFRKSDTRPTRPSEVCFGALTASAIFSRVESAGDYLTSV